MYSTRTSRVINAPRQVVYQALLDPAAIARWRVPDGMTAHVHAFDPREGGAFRVSLTYDAPAETGKSAAHTDTYHGHFARLVPNEQVVEIMQFESENPTLQTPMTMTTTLTDTPHGTKILILHEGIPDTIPATDNQTGTRMALTNLAKYLDGQRR